MKISCALHEGFFCDIVFECLFLAKDLSMTVIKDKK